MVCTDAVVFFEFGVVVFDGFVGGFDVGVWHCSWMLSESQIITDDADEVKPGSVFLLGVFAWVFLRISPRKPNPPDLGNGGVNED